MPKLKVWTVGDVECRQNIYESGLLEIGFYTPEFLLKAKPILRTVATRHAPGAAYFAHLSGRSGIKHRTRRTAIMECIRDAQRAHDIAKADVAAFTRRDILHPSEIRA